jgi:hypothetical protein
MENPFVERGRITDPRRFTARWRELAQAFEHIEARRPLLMSGATGIGKSSLLTHLQQSAAAVLEQPALAAFYLDLAVLPDADTCYRLVIEALGGSGSGSAGLELALLEAEGPVLLCLDNAEAAIAAGWGQPLLERLARTARSLRLGLSRTAGDAPYALPEINELLLAVALALPVPQFSEPFALVKIGPFAAGELRLFAEAYLDGTGVQFAPADLRELARLSQSHPAYLQRAAYHLFIAKIRPDYDWRAAYLAEARAQPLPGAALPPAIFAGNISDDFVEVDADQSPRSPARPPYAQPESPLGMLLALAPLLIGLLAWQLSGNWLIGLGLGVGVLVVVVWWVMRQG